MEIRFSQPMAMQ